MPFRQRYDVFYTAAHAAVFFCCLISENARKTVVIVDPSVDVDYAKVCFGVAHDDLFDPRVDDLPLTHHAARRVRNELARFRVEARHIKRRADHLVARSGNDRVRFRVDGTAQLISFAPRYSELVAHTNAEVAAVFSATRRAVITRRYYAVVLDDYRAERFAKTRASFGDGLCYIEIIIFL